jgi:nucleoside-diphosphate-sugar epimerase
VRLRYFDVFGQRHRADGAHASSVAQFLREMQRGRRPVIAGDGLQTRDFTCVDDVVQANLLAAEAPRVSGRVFNIATGQATSLLHLVTILNGALQTDLAPVHSAVTPDEPQHIRANIVHAQTELGFCPCTDLQFDVRRCLVAVGARLANQDALAPVSNSARASVPCYRLDGPAVTPTNSPHRQRDRTSRML